MRKKPQQSRATLPAGFVDTSGGGDFPKAWEPSPGDVLMGTCVSVRLEDAKRLKRTNAKKGEKVAIIGVADEDGEIRSVFESKGLETFCKEVKKGDQVFLKLIEVKKLGKKRFKVFESGIKKGKGK